MTALAGMMLVQRVMPIIQAAIARGAVKPVGCEDPEELAAEGVALAARSLEAAELKGKVVAPNSLAYYAIQALKSGRRSGYAGRQDAMCPAATLDKTVSVHSMDEVMGKRDDDDSEVTFHDMLASSGESADVVAARQLDWPMVAERLTAKEAYVVYATANDTPGTEMASHLKVCGPRVVQLKRGVARKIRQAWGDDAIADATRDSGWRRHVRSMTERRACRAARRAA